MKIRLLLILLLSISALQAQIGIGTTDPQETLHIEGDLFIEGVGGVEDSMALVGADDDGTLTTLELDNNLLIENNKLSLVRSTTYGIGDMDISGVIILANHVHDLDLQLGPGEINEGKTVIKVFGAPANFKLTGIQDGVDGMHLFFYHIGSTNIQFIDQTDTNALLSAPKNRINVLASSETISGQGSVEMIYDGTSQRWLFLSIHD
jgi:hypothetical protein